MTRRCVLLLAVLALTPAACGLLPDSKESKSESAAAEAEAESEAPGGGGERDAGVPLDEAAALQLKDDIQKQVDSRPETRASEWGDALAEGLVLVSLAALFTLVVRMAQHHRVALALSLATASFVLAVIAFLTSAS